MKKTHHRNGIRHESATKHRAIFLRRKGQTHREIARVLDIGLGTAHLWTKGVRMAKEKKWRIIRSQSEKRWTPAYRARQAKWATVHLAKYREKYSPNILLKMIRDFHRCHGRIPLKREFNMYGEYRRRFGSWNNAIRRAGFETNPIVFARKFVARDGHRCDSFTECLLDDWLSAHGIAHFRSFRYGSTRMHADFFLQPNTIIEFFGLHGVQDEYDVLIKRKRAYCRHHGFRLIELYPKHVYSSQALTPKFVDIFERLVLPRTENRRDVHNFHPGSTLQNTTRRR